MGTLTIVKTLESSWTSNSTVNTTYTPVLDQVITDLQNNLSPSSNITINITFGYGTVNGLPMGGGALGQSQWFINTFTYAAVRSALQGLTKNPLQTTAYSNTVLPSTSFLGSNDFYTTSALAKGIGLLSGSYTDGYVGIGTSFTYDLGTHGSTATPGAYSLYGVLMHEITEVLGRSCNTSKNATVYMGDLFAWTSGSHNLVDSGTRIGSADGTTAICTYYSPGGGSGDSGDWNGSPTDAFDASGTTNFAPSRSSSAPLSEADWKIMTLMGWGLTSTGLTNAGLATDSGDGIAAGTSTALAQSAADAASPGSAAGTSTALAIGDFTTFARSSLSLKF